MGGGLAAELLPTPQCPTSALPVPYPVTYPVPYLTNPTLCFDFAHAGNGTSIFASVLEICLAHKQDSCNNTFYYDSGSRALGRSLGRSLGRALVGHW